MAKCKIGGRSVTPAPVVHQNCLEELLGQICDQNCKWPVVCMNQDRLDLHCSRCPINKILESGGATS